MLLKNIFPLNFRKKKTFPVNEGCVIKEAFYDGTEQYFQLHDMFNTFTQRGMDALATYEQWNMRCTRKFLIDHTKAVDSILRDPRKINVIDIAELNKILKERLEWALPTEEIIWQFMAVAYFDRHESPYKYDDAYGKEKIKRWKAHNKIEDFFLSAPIGDLIPSPDLSREDLGDYLTMISKMDQHHLKQITSILSQSRQNNVS